MSSAKLTQIAESRRQQHLRAKEFLIQEQIHHALELMVSTYADFGANVLLIADMVACYYLLGRYDDAYSMTLKLCEEYEKSSQILSVNVEHRTLIMLGKSFEELGDLTRAFEIYQRILSRKQLDLTGNTTLSAKAQLLRLSCSLEKNQEIENLYYQCLTAKNESALSTSHIEHSLILAEISLFGFEISQERLISYLKNESVLETDKRLALIDFIELALLKDYHSSIRLRELRAYINEFNLDSYEQVVFDSWQTDNWRLEILEMNHLAKKVAPMGMIRILRLAYHFSQDELSKRQILVRQRLLMKSLPKASVMALQRFFAPVHESKNGIIIYFDSVTDEISSEGNYKTQKISEQLATIIKYLIQNSKTEISAETLIQEIYGLDFSDSTYDRLRKSIAKLSAYLRDLTGFESLLILTKTHLKVEVSFKNSESQK